MCCPNMIIQLDSGMSENQKHMPDVTLAWLLQQPVFVPYRVSVERVLRPMQPVL